MFFSPGLRFRFYGGRLRLLSGCCVACLIVTMFFPMCMKAHAADTTPAVPPGRIKAGVFLNPPFVMEQTGGGYTGMAVELWEEVVSSLGLVHEYVLYHDLSDLMRDTASGKVDAAAIDLSVTHERSRTLKFSYPWYDSGLRIMINREPGGSLWASLFKYKHLQVYLLFILFFIFLSVILTLIRRKHDPEFTGDWKEGLSISFQNVVESALQGKLEQRHLGWIGNLIFLVWLLFGVAAVAYITSTMTSAMTSTRLSGDIQQPADLPGKKIGVLHGSVGEAFFLSGGQPVQPFKELEDAVQSLLDKKIDVIVSDAPVLEYYVHENPDVPLAVVGDLFHPDKYCFASGYGNAELMDKVTVELIRLSESKRIAELKERFFTANENDEVYSTLCNGAMLMLLLGRLRYLTNGRKQCIFHFRGMMAG